MGRTPLRATPIRGEAEEATVAKPQRTRLRKNASMKSATDIDKDIRDIIGNQYGADLQWVADSVLGQPSSLRQQYEMQGWEPVSPDMFGGVLDGLYNRKGQKGEIRYEGLVLMERPMELTREAQAEEAKARTGAMEAQRSMVMNGIIPGLGNGMDSMHPTAAGKHVFSRAVKPAMDIPTE